MVVRIGRAQPVAEPGRVEACLELARDFGTEVRVANVRGCEGRVAGEPGIGPRTDGVERAGSAARLAIRGPQLDLPPRLAPEAFFTHDPGRARLGVHLQAEALAERAVPVDAHPER